MFIVLTPEGRVCDEMWITVTYCMQTKCWSCILVDTVSILQHIQESCLHELFPYLQLHAGFVSKPLTALSFFSRCSTWGGKDHLWFVINPCVQIFVSWHVLSFFPIRSKCFTDLSLKNKLLYVFLRANSNDGVKCGAGENKSVVMYML